MSQPWYNAFCQNGSDPSVQIGYGSFNCSTFFLPCSESLEWQEPEQCAHPWCDEPSQQHSISHLYDEYHHKTNQLELYYLSKFNAKQIQSSLFKDPWVNSCCTISSRERSIIDIQYIDLSMIRIFKFAHKPLNASV